MSESVKDQGVRRDSPQRRGWPHAIFPVVLGLVIIALVYWVIYRMPAPRVTLDFLRVLVWPVVIVIGLYWMRKPLGEKVAELLNVTGYGVDLIFAPRVLGVAPVLAVDVEPPLDRVGGHEPQTVEKTAIDTGSVTASETSELNAAAKISADGSVDASEPQKDHIIPVARGGTNDSTNFTAALKRRQQRNQDKAAIEEVVRESAAWGFDVAKLGRRTRPIPVIEWTEDGRPIIQYGENDSGQPTVVEVPSQGRDSGLRPHEKAMSARLEQEIRDLEIKIALVSLTTVGAGMGERERLRQLKAQLRMLDPESPLGL